MARGDARHPVYRAAFGARMPGRAADARPRSDAPIVLPSFGGAGLPLPYASIATGCGCTLRGTDERAARPVDATCAPSRRHRTGALGLGLQYQDLVAAADIVVSKPGYGIVSECVANHTALLFTSRAHFAEQDVFLREMPRVLRCAYLEPDRLIAGEWQEAIRGLLDQPLPPDTMRTDGAVAAADAILAAARYTNGR